MIKLKLLLEGQYDYGCVMAYIDEDAVKKIIEFGLKTIDDNIIYDKNNEFGREYHPHVTIKFGLTKNYSQEKMKEFLKSIKPFEIKIKGMSIFENDDFDVVKLDVESDVLKKLNKKFSKLPNEDEHPEYHPHLTLAYVKKGKGNKFIDKKVPFTTLSVSTIVYSDCGDKMHFDL